MNYLFISIFTLSVMILTFYLYHKIKKLKFSEKPVIKIQLLEE
jgi:hypothetical protein